MIVKYECYDRRDSFLRNSYLQCIWGHTTVYTYYCPRKSKIGQPYEMRVIRKIYSPPIRICRNERSLLQVAGRHENAKENGRNAPSCKVSTGHFSVVGVQRSAAIHFGLGNMILKNGIRLLCKFFRLFAPISGSRMRTYPRNRLLYFMHMLCEMQAIVQYVSYHLSGKTFFAECRVAPILYLVIKHRVSRFAKGCCPLRQYSLRIRAFTWFKYDVRKLNFKVRKLYFHINTPNNQVPSIPKIQKFVQSCTFWNTGWIFFKIKSEIEKKVLLN